MRKTEGNLINPVGSCRESLRVCSFPGMRQDYTLEHVPSSYSFLARPKRSSGVTSNKSTKKKNCFSRSSSKFVAKNLLFFVSLREVSCIRARKSRHGVTNVTECQTRIEAVIALTLSITKRLFYDIAKQYLTASFVSYKTVLKALKCSISIQQAELE